MRPRVLLMGTAAAALLVGCGTTMQSWNQPSTSSRPPSTPSRPAAVTAPTALPNTSHSKERHQASPDREEARAIKQLEEEHRRRLKKAKEAKLEEQAKREDVEAGAN